MNTRGRSLWELVTILAVAAPTFCAAQAISPARNFETISFRQQDQEANQEPVKGKEKKKEDQSAAAAGVTCADTPGGSAGSGTFTVTGIVSTDGDAIVKRNHKSCAVENAEKLKGHEGQRVRATASVGPDKNVIHVTHVEALGSEKAAAKKKEQ